MDRLGDLVVPEDVAARAALGLLDDATDQSNRLLGLEVVLGAHVQAGLGLEVVDELLREHLIERDVDHEIGLRPAADQGAGAGEETEEKGPLGTARGRRGGGLGHAGGSSRHAREGLTRFGIRRAFPGERAA